MILTELELERWGREIGRTVGTPVFLALRGELGAGKSVLARAVAQGAGVEGAMPSPTFNVLFRYPARDGASVVHIDLYRIDDPEEVWELGWEELPGDRTICLVEWPERAGAHLPDDRWEVRLRYIRNRPEAREIDVARVGDPPELPAFPLRVEHSR